MTGKSSDFALPTKGLDALFSTQEMRDEERLAKIQDIPLTEIDPFPAHPFRVEDNDDMMQLTQSIKEYGVLTPATVRRKADGRYELISGHRRKRASELAGLDALRCEVVELSDDDAVIMMVDGNLQRTKILPSEKAFAYKLRMDAIKRRAGRPKKNVSPSGTQMRSDELLAEEAGESRNQIHRYIRLTELEPALLEMVDEGCLAVRSAVELSYLSRSEQEDVLTEMYHTNKMPSLAQALEIKEAAKNGELSGEGLNTILTKAATKKRKLSFKEERLRQYVPQSIESGELEDYICKALEYYQEYLLGQ